MGNLAQAIKEFVGNSEVGEGSSHRKWRAGRDLEILGGVLEKKRGELGGNNQMTSRRGRRKCYREEVTKINGHWIILKAANPCGHYRGRRARFPSVS